MAEQRLQKILSQAGVASRRKAEDLITEGRVIVNGQVVTELGTKADIETDHIRVDGKNRSHSYHIQSLAGRTGAVTSYFKINNSFLFLIAFAFSLIVS